MPGETKQKLEEKIGRSRAAAAWERGGGNQPQVSSRPTEMFEAAAKPRQYDPVKGTAKKSDLEKGIVALQQQATDRGAESAQDYVNISQGGRTAKEIEVAKEETKKRLEGEKKEGIEVIPKAIKKTFIDPILKSDFIKDAWNTLKNVGGVFGALPVSFFKKLAHPEMEDFKDPKFLAVIDRLFKEKNKEGDKDFKKNYVDDYKKLMDEAFAGNEAMLAQGLSSEEFFNQQLGEASNLAKMGELGKGSQRINFPKEYYLDDGERGIMPQTTGDLENLAGLDASQYAGTDLAQMIFDARNELDRQTGGQGGGGGGGAGIMGAAPAAFTDANNNGIPDSLEVAQAATPAAEATPAATMTMPTPFDYSELGPHFGPQYPGHYENWGPNYVNQGLGQGSQFDYWNQIANAFQGMSQYG